MKKLLILLILMLFPFLVHAEECEVKGVSITSITQSGIEGKTQEIDEPSIDDNNLVLNIKMFEVGDSISYDIVVDNSSEEDYKIAESSFVTDSDYIEYSLKTNDNTNVIEAENSKTLSLVITYKKEVDKSLFVNNKYDASNNLSFSFNTNEIEKELEIITTNNIKNPNTSNHKITLIVVLFITSIAIITCLIIDKKTKYSKYVILLFAFFLTPVVYAVCEYRVEVESNIEIEYLPNLFETMEMIAAETNTCMTKYNGEVTDEVDKTVQATNVYFDNCPDQRNVIFGGYCWQIIRTTETHGIKMMYNGRPVDGKCETTRVDQLGFDGGESGHSLEVDTVNLPETYLYGSTFTYDETSKTFTLVNPTNGTWSDSTYKTLLSKYTCKNTTGNCTTIYHITDYYSNESALGAHYTIDLVNYGIIAKSAFNENNLSISGGGYMFNKSYNRKKLEYPLNYEDYLFGNNITYNDATNEYTLTDTVGPYRGYNHEEDLPTHHYTCWNATGTCGKVYYLVYEGYQNYYYVEMENGETIEDVIANTLTVENINKYDSTAKGLIESWYYNNLTDYTSYLEDTTYCNERTYSSVGVFNPDGGMLIERQPSFIQFKAYDIYNPYNKDISCKVITNQFSTINNKAKLQYPVGLFTYEELNNINNYDLLKISPLYWTMTLAEYEYYFGPWIVYVSGGNPNARAVTTGYSINHHGTGSNSKIGIRPAISLKGSLSIASGTGSETDPWIIE